MKRRRLLLVIAICVVAGAIAFLNWDQEAQPEHEGRKLSEWLADCRGGNLPTRERARQAIQAIGTNSLPCLLNWLRHDADSDWRTKAGRALQRLPVRLRWAEQQLGQYYQGQICFRAAQGLRILGTNAIPAIPELKRIMVDPKVQETNRRLARSVLTHIEWERTSQSAIPHIDLRRFMQENLPQERLPQPEKGNRVF